MQFHWYSPYMRCCHTILTLWIQPWPMRLVPPGNFRRHSIHRLCLPIRNNYYHSPRCVFWSEWQCSSYLRSFPILAGIYAEIKSLLGERLYLSRFTKVRKKKENNAFKFLKAIVFIYDVFTKYVEYNKEKEKGLTKLVRLFGNVTDQAGVREAIIALGFLWRKIISCFGFYFELPVLG